MDENEVAATIPVSRARAASLVDELTARRRALAVAQAGLAATMLEFAATRTALDEEVLADLERDGGTARYRAGEFAATEIALAVGESKSTVRRALGAAARVRSRCPDLWDAWLAGDVTVDAIRHVNHALRLLVRDESVRLLNALVVDVAVCKTPQLLRRWLAGFVARVEPDQADERIRRSLDDRYVSVRSDVDGVSVLSAALSAVDAAAVDRVLDALAAATDPGDPRTFRQRRADALVDVLLGRVGTAFGPSDGSAADHDSGDGDGDGEIGSEDVWDADDDGGGGDDIRPDHDPRDITGETSLVGVPPSELDPWELPASAHRPDPHHPPPVSSEPARRASCPTCGHRPGAPPPPRVMARIGVIVSMQSLFGDSNTPGQLADRSTLVPAGLVRELAARPGTLFTRLLTDPAGRLLDVTELGRFPSDRLGIAVKFRDGTCVSPVCAVPADGLEVDIDHETAHPAGPTTAGNLGDKCRNDHRAKTHASHVTSRAGDTSSWTTPTGHTYSRSDDPFPV